MKTRKHSYLASANASSGEIFAASPHIQSAVNIVLIDSGAKQCKVAVYDVMASLIDPDEFDSLFEFEYVGSFNDKKSLMEQCERAEDAYELRELRKFKLETLQGGSLGQENLDEIARLRERLINT
jgi:L-alanine-DL-glutamate epimerase-like enolase superfamily enzyme